MKPGTAVHVLYRMNCNNNLLFGAIIKCFQNFLISLSGLSSVIVCQRLTDSSRAAGKRKNIFHPFNQKKQRLGQQVEMKPEERPLYATERSMSMSFSCSVSKHCKTLACKLHPYRTGRQWRICVLFVRFTALTFEDEDHLWKAQQHYAWIVPITGTGCK